MEVKIQLYCGSVESGNMWRQLLKLAVRAELRWTWSHLEGKSTESTWVCFWFYFHFQSKEALTVTREVLWLTVMICVFVFECFVPSGCCFVGLLGGGEVGSGLLMDMPCGL